MIHLPFQENRIIERNYVVFPHFFGIQEIGWR
jgi:hypothetical protein